jgi:hypothetical protein
MVEANDTMTFHEPFGPADRVIVAAGGLFTFMAPWELLIKHGHNPFRLVMLPFWVISLGALSIGLPLLASAMLGGGRTLVFDFAARTLVERVEGSFRFGWTRTRSFAQIAALAVVEDRWTDGPAEWLIEARPANGGKPWHIAKRTSEKAATALAEEIACRSGLAVLS